MATTSDPARSTCTSRGLEALGASFQLRHGYLEARAEHLFGADISLEFPSVGATENIVMAAVHAKGTTVLENAAREPEIVDLCRFLNAMGAKIDGIGSPRLVIHGVEQGSLVPVRHSVVPDRVEAATFVAAAAIAGGELDIVRARPDHMDMLLRKVTEMGVKVTDTGEGLRVRGPRRLHSVDVATLPYPGIATDYKPLFTAMLSVADGVGIVTENLFAGRFRYVEELVRLGADIRTDSHHAVVRGVPRLSGAPVTGARHPGGCGHGDHRPRGRRRDDHLRRDHVDRGYDDLVGKLQSVGADVERA